MIHARWLRDLSVRMRIGGMTALLVLLVLNVFVVPFSVAPDDTLARLLREVFLSLILLSGVVAVAEDRAHWIAIALVAVVAMLVNWTGWFLPPGQTPGLTDATTLVSLAVLGAVIGVKVFSRGTVTFDRILGAVTLYILIGVVWAQAYQIVSFHVPHAYAGNTGADGTFDSPTAIYFSFVTLTTVGYGDITPVAHVAKSLAIVEGLLGQLYPAIILARLVSLQTTAPAAPADVTSNSASPASPSRRSGRKGPRTRSRP